MADDAEKVVSEALKEALAEHRGEASLVLALSGGRDSMALLQALFELVGPKGFIAIHVNHGIAADTDRWEEHCRAACSRLGVDFVAERLDGGALSGGNIEAKARLWRYRALLRHAIAPSLLLMAHHRDDQAETVLYRLFHGVGVHGAGGMSQLGNSGRPGVALLRPFLEVDAAEIDSYACAKGIEWVEDPLNDEMRFERNWLRHEVLPLLRRRHPDIAKIVAGNAARFSSAHRLCLGLARSDHARLHDAGSDGLATPWTLLAPPVRQSIDIGEGANNPAKAADAHAGGSVMAASACVAASYDSEVENFEGDAGGSDMAVEGGAGGLAAESGLSGAQGSFLENAGLAADANRCTILAGDLATKERNLAIDKGATENAFGLAHAEDFPLPPRWPRWRRRALAQLDDERIENLCYCYLDTMLAQPPRGGVIAGLRQWLRGGGDEYRVYRLGALNFRLWRDWLYVDDWRDEELAVEGASLGQWRAGGGGPGLPSFDSLAGKVGVRLDALSRDAALAPCQPGQSMRLHGHRQKIKKILQGRAIEPWLRGRVLALGAGQIVYALALPDGWLLGDDALPHAKVQSRR